MMSVDFDFGELLERVGGDEELASELIDIFGQESPAILYRMEQALRNRDTEELGYAAHTFKGSAATLSAVRLAGLATRVELAARARDLSAATTSYLEMKDHFYSLMATLGSSAHQA